LEDLEEGRIRIVRGGRRRKARRRRGNWASQSSWDERDDGSNGKEDARGAGGVEFFSGMDGMAWRQINEQQQLV
jgi:hypothetical protein